MKYIIVVVFGVLWVGFMDEDSVWSHLRNKERIGELQAEIARYRKRYNHDQAQLKMLDTDPKAIEKIARERYFMKKADEDIFILSDDNTDFSGQEEEDETTE